MGVENNNLSLNFLTWNTTGIMSSCTYLCDTLNNLSIDICGIAEHWLYEKDLHFLDQIDNRYRSHAVSDTNLNIPSRRKVGKGGVALLWNRKYDNRVSTLTIDDDRIVGIQFEANQNDYLFILQVYLPCSNYSNATYMDYLDKLDNLINIYSEKGTVFIMGDFNANLMSNTFHKAIDGRCRTLQSFLNDHNYLATNTLDLCTGARSTFVSYDGVSESLIDHFIIPVEKVDLINECSILEDDILNMSRHRPIFCSVQLSHTNLNSLDFSKYRINWKKANDESQTVLENDRRFTSILHTNHQNIESLDRSYNVVVESLNNASIMF